MTLDSARIDTAGPPGLRPYIGFILGTTIVGSILVWIIQMLGQMLPLVAALFVVVGVLHLPAVGILAGLVIRKPGAIAFAAVSSMVLQVALVMLSASLLPDGRYSLYIMGVGALAGAVATVAIGEPVGLVLWRRPRTIGSDLLFASAVVIGWIAVLFALSTVIAPLVDFTTVAVVVINALIAVSIAVPVRRSLLERLALRAARTSVQGAGPAGAKTASGYGATIDHPSSTTALVLGLLGLLLFQPLAPVAWATGAKARRETMANPQLYRPSGSAQAGFVLGIIGTVILVVELIALVVFFLMLSRGY